MNRKTNGHTFWANSMSGTMHEKISRVTAATTLRLPRSAHTATGSPQAIWDTPPTKATAPRPASLRWNERWMSGASVPMPLEKVPGIERGEREQHEGRDAALAQDARQRRRLALAGAGHELEVGHRLAVAARGDRLAQQLVGDGEVEERRLPAWLPHSTPLWMPAANGST